MVNAIQNYEIFFFLKKQNIFNSTLFLESFDCDECDAKFNDSISKAIHKRYTHNWEETMSDWGILDNVDEDFGIKRKRNTKKSLCLTCNSMMLVILKIFN